VDGLHVHECFDNVVLEQDSVSSAGLSGEGDYFSAETGSETLSSGDLAHAGLALFEVDRELD